MDIVFLLTIWVSLFTILLKHCCLCLEKKVFYETQIDGLIAAFNDFDSDRFTDVFIITDRGSTMKLLKSLEEKPILEEWDQVQCSFDYGEKIQAVIPADFSGDATMDVMAVTKRPNSSKFKIWIFYGNKTGLDCDANKKPLLENALGQPLILDYNGDMIADFLVETETCRRELWLMGHDKLHGGECLQNKFGNVSMLKPNSNAFVNIRNCLPDSMDYATDVVITGEDRIEYWLSKAGFRPENKVTIRYPDKAIYTIGQSIFIDLNIDGCIEHIIAACKKENDLDQSNCSPQILWYDQSQYQWINIADFSNHSQLYFDSIQTNHEYDIELPISVRFGDVDSDGYVDLITVMKNRTDSGKIKQVAIILRNVADPEVANRRKFVIFWSSETFMKNEEDVVLASFLDIEENGKLDIILTVQNTTKPANFQIKWILNTFVDNSCFLKILVASGLCSETCPNERVPYGTNQAGPFVCYETSDLNGNLLKGCSAQLSQSAHFALQMPYSVFGLGETPNFVETVIASIPSGDQPVVRKSRWTQIVPDAQLVLIPYPPNATDYWICKLFYTPSNMVSSTLAALAILCAVLVIIILILHRKEVLEDLAEHQEYKRHWPESR